MNAITLDKRDICLDFLRGFAILYIVFVHHLGNYANGVFTNSVDTIVTYAFLGALVYISGFVLTYPDGAVYQSPLRVFFVKRFLRIYPPYLIAILVFLIAGLVNTKGAVCNALLINVVTNDSMPTLWYVSMMVIYYLIFPVIHAQTIQKLIKTCIVFSVVAFLGVYVHYEFGLIDLRVIYFFPMFLLGNLARNMRLVNAVLHGSLVTSMTALLGLVTAALYVIKYESLSSFHAQIVLLVAVYLLLPLLLKISKLFVKFVHAEVILNLAYASFVMYLSHRVIFQSLLNLYQPDSTCAIVFYLLAAGGPSIFIISYCFQKAYDMAVRFVQPNGKTG